MPLVKKKLLTIVTESALQTTLIKELKRHSVTEYTQMESYGEGAKGVRTGDWDQNRNVTIQVICSEELGEYLLNLVHTTYCEDYALIAYLSDIEVPS